MPPRRPVVVLPKIQSTPISLRPHPTPDAPQATHQIVQQLRLRIELVHKPAEAQRARAPEGDERVELALERALEEDEARVRDRDAELHDEVRDARGERVERAEDARVLAWAADLLFLALGAEDARERVRGGGGRASAWASGRGEGRHGESVSTFIHIYTPIQGRRRNAPAVKHEDIHPWPKARQERVRREADVRPGITDDERAEGVLPGRVLHTVDLDCK